MTKWLRRIIIILTMLTLYTNITASKERYCIHNLQTLYKSKKITPQDVVLLWDLHGVLSKPHIKQVIKYVWEMPKKLNILKAFFDKKTYTTIWNLKKAGHDCSEQYATALLKNVKSLKQYNKTDAISMINAQKPIKRSISILKRMKKQAAGNILFSNIGLESWKSLQNKSGYEFLNDFDDAIVCSNNNTWKAKPHKDAFNYAKDKIYKKFARSKILILIDDNLENVKAARSAGIYALWFQNPKQLQKQLRTIGFI